MQKKSYSVQVKIAELPSGHELTKQQASTKVYEGIAKLKEQSLPSFYEEIIKRYVVELGAKSQFATSSVKLGQKLDREVAKELFKDFDATKQNLIIDAGGKWLKDSRWNEEKIAPIVKGLLGKSDAVKILREAALNKKGFDDWLKDYTNSQKFAKLDKSFTDLQPNSQWMAKLLYTAGMPSTEQIGFLRQMIQVGEDHWITDIFGEQGEPHSDRFFPLRKNIDSLEERSASPQIKQTCHNIINLLERLDTTLFSSQPQFHSWIYKTKHSCSIHEDKLDDALAKEFNDKFDSWVGPMRKALEALPESVDLAENSSAKKEFSARAYDHWLESMKTSATLPQVDSSWYIKVPATLAEFRLTGKDDKAVNVKVVDSYIGILDSSAEAKMHFVSLSDCERLFPNHYKAIKAAADSKMQSYKQAHAKDKFITEDEFDFLVQNDMIRSDLATELGFTHAGPPFESDLI